MRLASVRENMYMVMVVFDHECGTSYCRVCNALMVCFVFDHVSV